MSTIFDSFAESQEVSGKGPSPHPLHSEPANEADLACIIVEHSTEDRDLVALQTWLRTATSSLLKVQNISFEQAEALQVKLQEGGHKVRFDWRHSDQTAVFRMATSLHNSPATWLTLCVRDVQRTVQESARCGTPLLLVHGDGRIKYPGGTSQPDNRIDVNVHFQHNGEADTYCVPEPRVVLETAFSQPLQDAEDKAWEYLCTGDGHTHAVIVVDMSYPVTPQKDFKAKIAVWSRQDTGDDDVDYPFEASEEYPHEPLPTPEEEHSPESPGGSNASSLAGSRSATLISEGTTKVDDIHPPRSICKKAADGSDWTIETPGYIVFLDEKKDAHPDTSSPPGFELLLDTFHFLRRCPKHPRDIPRPSEVSLPLAPLRSCVMEALVRHRDEQWPRKRKADVAVEDAGESTSPENVDSAAMRSKTPPMLRKWKQVKKSRRGA